MPGIPFRFLTFSEAALAGLCCWKMECAADIQAALSVPFRAPPVTQLETGAFH